jgi:hypothetical protein
MVERIDDLFFLRGDILMSCPCMKTSNPLVWRNNVK